MTSKKKILVAEDDSGITDVIDLILTDAGYEIVATKDGKKVLTLLNQEVDAVLLDVRLSGADGREICRKIKSSKQFANTPVVLFSADHNIDAIAKDTGADAFIRKPFDMDELLGLIERVLRV